MRGLPLVEAYTLKEFCEAHRISPAFFYELRKLGLAPRVMRGFATSRSSAAKRPCAGEQSAPRPQTTWKSHRKTAARKDRRLGVRNPRRRQAPHRWRDAAMDDMSPAPTVVNIDLALLAEQTRADAKPAIAPSPMD